MSQDPDNREGIERRPGNPRWAIRRVRSLLVIGLLVLISGIAIVVKWTASRETFQPPSFAGANISPNPSMSVGEEVRLYIRDRNLIMVAADERSLDDLIRAIGARNDEVQELTDTGRVFTVANGTRARIVETGFGRLKVRIIEGDKIMSEGWIPELWVK